MKCAKCSVEVGNGGILQEDGSHVCLQCDAGGSDSSVPWLTIFLQGLLAMVCIQLMLAWWCKYGGWAKPSPGGGMILPGPPPWMANIFAVIETAIKLTPSLVLGVVGWIAVVVNFRTCEKTQSTEAMIFWRGLVCFACLWTLVLLYAVALNVGATMQPIFKFPL